MAAVRPDVTVVTSGHDVADARLHRLVAAFQRQQLSVEMLGLGTAEGAPPGVRAWTRPRGAMLARVGRALRWPWKARGRVVLTCDPDTVVAASLRAALGRIRWVADVHEDYVALLDDRPWVPKSLRQLLKAVTGVLLRLSGRADLTVVADDHVPPPPGRARDRFVLRNVPDYAMLPAQVAGPDDPLRAIYIGDLRTSRGLRDMVAAVWAAPAWALDLVGPVAAADQGWLEEQLVDGRLAGRVTWHGRQPPVQAWALARNAQVGLALLQDTPAFRAAMPSKIYEYLACGLAVVASPLPRVGALLDETGAGCLVRDAAAAASLLAHWSADRAVLRAHQQAAAQWGLRARAESNPYDALALRVASLAREPRHR